MYLRMRIILFVWIENTFRSVLCEAIFNSKAPPGWSAESAGVNPATTINPAVVDLLREISVALPPKKPRVVTPEMIAAAWRVITFGCLDRCPVGAEDKSEDWPILGSTGKSFDQLREIRDEISRRIDCLIASILKTANP